MEITEERSVVKGIKTAENLGVLRTGVWRGRDRRQESSWAKENTSGLSEGCLTLADVALKDKTFSLRAT